MITEINNTEDIIDSRDIIERIDELESLQADDTIDSDELNELKILKELAEECSSYSPDWQYGEALILDSYFEEYAQQLAEDCGMVNSDASWPNNCIDWEQAARELQIDYTYVDFDGEKYWIRSC